MFRKELTFSKCLRFASHLLFMRYSYAPLVENLSTHPRCQRQIPTSTLYLTIEGLMLAMLDRTLLLNQELGMSYLHSPLQQRDLVPKCHHLAHYHQRTPCKIAQYQEPNHHSTI
ncbi:hypothetical protein V6Z12_A13G195500 [Gossypium hirsutum]